MISSRAFIASSLSKITLDPGQPRLTWYGPDHERIELSGAVLNNWVSKTTNLLVEEFDAEPGVEVGVCLPAHWRSLVWSVATLLTGATLNLGNVTESGAVLVTDLPNSATAANRSKRTDLVAVTLAGLARKYPGTLPSGTIDAASAVMTYGDSIWQTLNTEAHQDAIVLGTERVTFAELSQWAGGGDSERHLIRCQGGAPQDVGELTGQELEQAQERAHARDLYTVLQQALSIWAAGGSAVIVSPEVAAQLAADPERLARLIDSERITVS